MFIKKLLNRLFCVVEKNALSSMAVADSSEAAIG